MSKQTVNETLTYFRIVFFAVYVMKIRPQSNTNIALHVFDHRLFAEKLSETIIKITVWKNKPTPGQTAE